MTAGVGEGAAMQREKVKPVKGYRVSLLDWGRGRNKNRSEEQCSESGRDFEEEEEEDDRDGSETRTGTTDPRQKSTTTPTTASNNATTKSNTDSSSLVNDSPKDSSPPIYPTSRNRKGKSPLPRSLLHRSSSSGSDSDVTSISSSNSSSSFSYGPPEFQDAKSKEEEPIIPDLGMFKSTRLAQVPMTELVRQMDRGDIMGALIPTVAQCAAHLALLGCFSKLRAKVEGSEEIERWLFGKEHDLEGTSDAGDIKWRAFVGKAVERFHMWWINFPEVVKNLPEPVDCGKHGLLSLHEKPECTPAKKQVRVKPIEDRNLFRQWKRKPVKHGVMDIFTEFQKNDFASGISFRNMTPETLPPLGTFHLSGNIILRQD